MNNLIITLIRHGKVDGPAGLYGRTDIPLSAAGHRDLTCTLNNLHAQTPIDQMISSPRIRCSQVAQAFCAQHKIPLHTEDKLQEMDFGIWDGIPFDALGDEWKNIEAFWESPHRMQPPQGESLTDFATRVIAGWESLINNTEPGHRAIICHGGVIRILIAHLLQLDWRNPALFKQLHIDYASCTRIEIGHYDGALPIVKWIGGLTST
ncbi:alpha-ribazole phosphatase family protein [Cellvibrio sp. PSBB023]|uniref:alpha-ribazole phosphatase family protein n=1 Tax=Cellvibrio sp. PSBB023 TaxID=1945512 RepID=UPI00098F08EF|nr:alpha-ribazole phosphatase family protein [Cellvibrio sp. PSBB023]AQT58781.1 histidine phosphatase family protein [Cellvibrio sp. PSBB023]